MQWRCYCTSCRWVGYRVDGSWAEHRFAHRRVHPKPCPVCGNRTVVGSCVRLEAAK